MNIQAKKQVPASLYIRLGRHAVCLLVATSAFAANAEEDFDCYSKDQRVWVSGKIADDASGHSYFKGAITVTFDDTRLRDHIYQRDMVAGSRPIKFTYIGADYKLRIDWDEKVMLFDYSPGGIVEPLYTYFGSVTCD